MEGQERRPETRDEAAERHEVEERHELGSVRAVRMVVDHREFPGMPRAEIAECRQPAGHESGQGCCLAISMAHTDSRRNRFAVRFASGSSELPTRKLRGKFLSKPTMPRPPNRRPLPVLQSVRWTYRVRPGVL